MQFPDEDSMKLETERLIIRSWTENDANEMCDLYVSSLSKDAWMRDRASHWIFTVS